MFNNVWKINKFYDKYLKWNETCHRVFMHVETFFKNLYTSRKTHRSFVLFWGKFSPKFNFRISSSFPQNDGNFQKFSKKVSIPTYCEYFRACFILIWRIIIFDRMFIKFTSKFKDFTEPTNITFSTLMLPTLLKTKNNLKLICRWRKNSSTRTCSNFTKGYQYSNKYLKSFKLKMNFVIIHELKINDVDRK